MHRTNYGYEIYIYIYIISIPLFDFDFFFLTNLKLVNKINKRCSVVKKEKGIKAPKRKFKYKISSQNRV